MEINEISVIVCEGKNFPEKYWNKNFKVIFGVDKEKYETSFCECDTNGHIVLNEEQNIHINSNYQKLGDYKPLLFILAENKSNSIGKATVSLNKLTTTRKRYNVPIQLKNCKDLDEKEYPFLIYEACISKYLLINGDTLNNEINGFSLPEKHKKSPILKQKILNVKSPNYLNNHKPDYNNESTTENITNYSENNNTLESEQSSISSQFKSKLHKVENFLHHSTAHKNKKPMHKRNLSSSNASDTCLSDSKKTLSKTNLPTMMKNFIDSFGQTNGDYIAKHSTLPKDFQAQNFPNEGGNNVPIITGISPMEAATSKETKITIRGSNLGQDLDDILSIHICDFNCLPHLTYHSPSKLVTTIYPESIDALNKSHQAQSNMHPACEVLGQVLLVTRSGGPSRCLIQFRIFDQEAYSNELAQTYSTNSDSFINSSYNNNATDTVAANDCCSTNLTTYNPGGLYYLDLTKGDLGDKEGKSDLSNINNNNNNMDTSMASTGTKRNTSNLLKASNGILKHLNLKKYAGNTSSQENYLRSLENCGKETLVEEIGNLRKHVEILSHENILLKQYIDRLVLRVMEICPEHLEKNVACSARTNHPKKNTL